jgi:hypothetical protein
MPPLEITNSDVQRAVKEFKAIEQRVDARMSAAAAQGGETGTAPNSAVIRMAAIFGIKAKSQRK